MSEKLMRIEHDISTGAIQYVEMTDEEQAQHEANAQAALALQQEQDATAEQARLEVENAPQRIASLESEMQALKEMVKQLAKR